MAKYRAFIRDDDDNEKFILTYYHNPKRWVDNLLEQNNPIRDIANWSNEIKYLNAANDDLSEDIKALPKSHGGIYMFYIKGLNLPFVENYILYIGRCQYTKTQNINKRAKEYFKDERIEIKRMFRKWKEHLYYRYYPDTDNELIRSNEVKLIRAIAPEYNEEIPNKIDIQESVPAFNNSNIEQHGTN